MKVLVIGSGAREHAIAHALMRGGSVSEVTVAPGNPGMELDGIRTTQINPSNHAALIDFVKNNGYDWVFVGPEVPLIEGIVDDFAGAGIKAFGPVSYTHLTLPTKRIVLISGVAASLKKKNIYITEHTNPNSNTPCITPNNDIISASRD